MKSGIQSNQKPVKKRLVPFLFILGTILLVFFFFLYSYLLIKKTEKESKTVPHLLSRFILYSGKESFEQIVFQFFEKEIITQIDYPIIITNYRKVPVYWKNVGIKEKVKKVKTSSKDRLALREKIHYLEKNGYEIPIIIRKDTLSLVIGYTYYDDSKAFVQLRLLPFLMIFVIVSFILAGFLWQSYIKKNEKDILWIGLAKETAHQFGTPISSLVGWVDLLKSRFENSPQHQDIIPMLDHMHSDIDLLRKVASRFGKVGSKINLQPQNLDAIIQNSISYFQTRLPHFNHKIEIHFISKIKEINIRIDLELFQWAIENLLKNCIDAMQNKGGVIVITAFQTDRDLCILFKDEGTGISKNMIHKIFEPGITTKKRGWGLGLSLTKRIIEQYHQGKIKVLETTINEGTTMEISLPVSLIVPPIQN